ncbi:MAG: hypothetical protein HZB34_06085 [Nitrospirae bacterium]|nr:hypothetical protein [Nitrospirota bacterium]
MSAGRLLRYSSRTLLCGSLLLSSGCVHRIHVTAAPQTVSPVTIAQSLQVIVPSLALEGADHRQGITLLEWPAEDLRSAITDYIRSRQTFTSVGDRPADLTLTVKSWLAMRSSGNYHYRLRLESTLGPSAKPPVKSYLVEKETMGSSVRWVTASDQRPIVEAVQAAMDDLLAQIEADHLLYRKGPS